MIDGKPWVNGPFAAAQAAYKVFTPSFDAMDIPLSRGTEEFRPEKISVYHVINVSLTHFMKPDSNSAIDIKIKKLPTRYCQAFEESQTMKRRVAVVKDTLSRGGQVLEVGWPPVKFLGHQAALIGGPAFCAACKSAGIIAKSGGPNRNRILGREQALDGDIVLCACPTPPHIVATLGGNSRVEDDIHVGGKQVSPEHTAKGGIATMTEGLFDERVKATNSVTERMPYCIETADGSMHYGCLDEPGRLPRIYTGDNPEDYVVYWGDDALAKQHGE